MITLPNADEVHEYGRPPEPRSVAVPLIVDDEPVCRVRVLETGSAAFWSRGDVDVHVLHARQHGLVDGLVHHATLTPDTSHSWLARALRERREQRRLLLLRGGMQTTASGLVVLQAPTQLVLPTRT